MKVLGITIGAATAPLSPSQVTEGHESAKKAMTLKLEENSKKSIRLREDLAKMSKELFGTEKFSEKGPGVWKHIIWILGLLAVAVVEIPLNAMSFEIFDRTQDETTAMAVVAGILIAGLAHATGFFFKRWTVRNEQRTTNGLLAFVCLTVAIFGLWTLAGFRVQYRNEIGDEDTVSQFQQAGFAFLVFFIGVLASFFHTSSAANLKLEKDFYKELKTLRDNRSKLDKLIKERDAMNKQYPKDLAQAEKQVKDEAKKEADEAKKEVKKGADAKISEEEALNKKNSEFTELKNKFNQLFEEVNNRLTSKTGVDLDLYKNDIAFIDAKTQLEFYMEEMEKLSKEVTVADAEELVIKAKESFKSINN